MKFSSKITAVFLSLLILVSGSGLAISSHTCSNSHKTETQLFERTSGCCSTQKPPCTNPSSNGLKSNCCLLKIAFQKVQIISPVNEVKSNVIFLPAVVLPTFQTVLFTDTKKLSFQVFHSPPLVRESLFH